MNIDLDGLPAVVTGSSRGLGRAFALALAEAGARVVVNGTRPGPVQETADAIRKAGGTAVTAVGSVADHSFCQDLIETCVGEFGSIGLLVNNAGLTRDHSLLKMTPEAFDEVVAVHLRGTWSCVSAAAKVMRSTGGRIVNISSGAGLFGMFGQGNYAAAKAGIVGLNRVIDLELARFGVRSNVLAPVARTDMTAVFDGAVAHQLEFPPPESVAPIVVYLAGEGARDIRGQVLSFDGTVLSVWSHPRAVSTVEHTSGWTPGEFARALTPEVMESAHPDRWGAGVLSS
ncbi:SDR family NAD(P)-dependent oxidoreductase [Amycolatopsis sp. NPDC049691]|uniref:SDR family NAD(P)-dependent oxidoreductase n=1 Tax=Amycolatopsis sp. NPDC049691 TaxID=3155155 RepID=UPI003421558C